VAAMKVFGMEIQLSTPSACPIPEQLIEQSTTAKVKFLHNAAAKVLDEMIDNSNGILLVSAMAAQEQQDEIDNQVLNADGRYPCRFPDCPRSFKYDGRSRINHEASHDPPVVCARREEHHSKAKKTSKDMSDDIYNYNCGFLLEGLTFLNFIDAIAEGDGERIFRQYKYMLLYFKADAPHSNKYALECLFQNFLVTGILSERDAHLFIWNRSVNNFGGIGKHIPLDLAVEHSNNFLKQTINNLGVNVNENAVNRICKAEAAMRSVLYNLDRDLKRKKRSGEHQNKTADTADIDILIKMLKEKDVFTYTPGRTYRHCNDFERNPMVGLDMSKLYQWINNHKKNMSLGKTAR